MSSVGSRTILFTQPSENVGTQRGCAEVSTATFEVERERVVQKGQYDSRHADIHCNTLLQIQKGNLDVILRMNYNVMEYGPQWEMIRDKAVGGYT